MNFDAFENKLRSQRRREIPPQWRREILGAVSIEPSAPVIWWRQLLWPHPAAWASIAAAWVAIFVLNFVGAPESASRQAANKPSRDMRLAYEQRQRLWAELVEISPSQRHQVPAADRPRSHVLLREVTV